MSNEVIYQEESLSDIIDDLKELIGDHYKEIALYQDKVKLEPNYDFYYQAEELGKIRFYTVRDSEKLVGYFVVIVTEHAHYSSHLFANNDIIYIKEEYRNFSIGKGLISFAEESLRDEGVSVLNVNTKTHQPFDNLMIGLGYDCVERVYGKYIGE